MLHQIIGFSIKNKLIVGLCVLALVLWGGYEVTRLPIDAVPDITDNQVQVLTVSPALGAPDVERLITFPVEQACSNIPGLKQIRSFSRFGLSLVTIVFTDETDLYLARQQISERLQQVQQEIPDGIGKPEMAPVTTGLGEIYQYVVRPKPGYEHRYSPMELRTLQDWTVRRQLMGTPGVAEVSSFGGHLKQYEIAVKPELLKANNITIADVFDALEKNNQNTGGAYIEKGPTVLYIRSEGLTSSMEDIENIVIKTMENGLALLVRDVARVQLGAAIRYGAMTYNDQGEVAGAVVRMLKGENSSQVIKRVKEKVALIQKDLPEGVIIEPFLDRTKMVNNAITTVEHNLMEGALIVVFVLVFFLGNFRAGLIVSSVIPLSMLFAIILMNHFGIGGNLMSLGAIDFGLIVDGSVIVVEAILHRFSHSHHFRNTSLISQQQMDQEVHKSSGQTIKSAVFSQIIILIVYLPILSLQGVEGKMFKPMAYTIAFAILGAFLLSVTYVPMMSALFLNKKLSHKVTLADKIMIWLERKYMPLLKKILGFPKSVITLTVTLLIIAVLLLGNMGGEFIPQIEEGDFAVETRLLTGSNLSNTVEYTQKASRILLNEYPEVEKVVTKIGSAEIPTDPMPLEAGDMMVILKDKKEWTSAATFKELAQKMTQSLSVIPGITVGFQFPVQMRFNELMTGARQDVVCKIFGEHLDTLAHFAHRLNEIIQTVPGAVNIYEETVTGMPQLVIKYNRKAMAAYGLNVQDINRIVNTAFAGQTAGRVYEGEKRFDLVVRLDGEARKNLQDIKNLLVPAAGGQQIPISMVADIEEVESINQIQRENTRRRIVLGFNVRDRDVQSIVTELQQKVAKDLKLPAGYHLEYGGSFENMNAAKARLSIVVPIALLLIFLLLYFAFNSVRQGLLIYTAIPLSAIGGVFALWARDMPFSISAGVGFIALFGVAVLNGILLVTEFNRLKKEGWTDTRRIVVHATKSKLRAVLMTALVPSLGFIPMAVSTGAGGEVQKPLATVVIGGLMVSTLLTLFVLPLFYVLFEKGNAPLKFSKKQITTLLLLGATAFGVNAQDSLTVEKAIQMALEQNAGLKASRLNDRYYQELVASAWDPEQTRMGVEYGKLNSSFTDNRWSISQNILFPTVYVRQKKVLQAQANVSRQMTDHKEWELQTEVKQVFYALLTLRDKKMVLLQADSLFAIFSQKTEQRLQHGDVDLLEATTAANQRLQISTQRTALEVEEENFRNRLTYLIDAKQALLPVSGHLLYPFSISEQDTTNIENAPQLRILEREFQFNRRQYHLERSRLLPSISVGYANMSIIGWQTLANNQEQYFGGSKRFAAVNAGIGIPLFFGAQRARIKAAKIGLLQKEQEQEDVRARIRTTIKDARNRYSKQQEQLRLYEQQLLPNANTIITTATHKRDMGEIDYLQWVILIHQSIGIKSQYYETLSQLNETAFQLERLSGNQQ